MGYALQENNQHWAGFSSFNYSPIMTFPKVIHIQLYQGSLVRSFLFLYIYFFSSIYERLVFQNIWNKLVPAITINYNDYKYHQPLFSLDAIKIAVCHVTVF